MKTKGNTARLQTPVAHKSELLTTSEAAAELRKARSTIQRLCREEKLPHVRLSPRDYRIRRSDLESWMNSLTRGPQVAAMS